MNWLLFGSVFIVILILLCVVYWKEIRYYWKFHTFFGLGFLLVILFLPTTFRRPSSVENNVLVCRFVAFFFRWIGVKYELRGAEHLAKQEGAMWATNHQQMIDILGLFNCTAVAKRFVIIMKRELLNHPAGLACKMYGIVFLDRRGESSAQDVNKWAHDARDQKYKVWIHPEGTRSFEAFKSQCLLPFKKGTFYAAVNAQIPILPMVFSPYYFINYHERVFGRGRVIMDVLPPISTVGLTKDDVPQLLNHVRTIMTNRYRQLTDEVLSSLAPDHPVFQWINDVD